MSYAPKEQLITIFFLSPVIIGSLKGLIRSYVQNCSYIIIYIYIYIYIIYIIYIQGFTQLFAKLRESRIVSISKRKVRGSIPAAGTSLVIVKKKPSMTQYDPNKGWPCR